METQHVQAIFANGKLLPLQPLDLNDQEQVELTESRSVNAGSSDHTNCNSLIGILSDMPELTDLITDSTMNAREAQPIHGVAGSQLLKFAGVIDLPELAAMTKSIQEGCENSCQRMVGICLIQGDNCAK